MAVEIITKTDFDADVHSCFNELLDELNIAPAPNSWELAQLCCALGHTPQITVLRRNGAWEGISIGHIVRCTVYGIPATAYRLIGDDSYDYLALLCRPGSLSTLLRAIGRTARSAGADLLNLKYLVGLAADASIERYVRTGNTRYFDAEASPDGWDTILRQRDLRRKDRRIRRETLYRCEHRFGDFTDEDLQTLMHLHIERWRFSGPHSQFEEPRARQALLSYPRENKLLTRLYDGDELIAAHFGMQLGDTLIFYTPAISVKHLRHSPLMQLLLETARFCQSRGLRFLDLGIGDEAYKMRVSNADREFAQIVFPLSMRGWLAHGLFYIRKRWGSQLRSVAGSMGAVQLRIKRKISHLIHTVRVYRRESDAKINIDSPHQFATIVDWPALVDLARRNRFPNPSCHFDRLRESDRFLYLHDGQNVLSYGWATTKPVVCMGEVGRCVDNRDAVMLYDFWTPESFRGKGHYTELLKHICRSPIGNVYQIYVLSGNVPSRRAIENVGFKHVRTYRGRLVTSSGSEAPGDLQD